MTILDDLWTEWRNKGHRVNHVNEDYFDWDNEKLRKECPYEFQFPYRHHHKEPFMTLILLADYFISVGHVPEIWTTRYDNVMSYICFKNQEDAALARMVL